MVSKPILWLAVATTCLSQIRSSTFSIKYKRICILLYNFRVGCPVTADWGRPPEAEIFGKLGSGIYRRWKTNKQAGWKEEKGRLFLGFCIYWISTNYPQTQLKITLPFDCQLTSDWEWIVYGECRAAATNAWFVSSIRRPKLEELKYVSQLAVHTVPQMYKTTSLLSKQATSTTKDYPTKWKRWIAHR